MVDVDMKGAMLKQSSICPVCDKKDSLKRLHELPLGHVHDCSVCKSSTFLPTPSEDELITAYQKFNAGEIARQEFDSYVDISQRIIERDLEKAGVVSRRGLTMLDYGCGGGHFVKAAKRLGIDAVGIDVDEEGARFGREHGLRIGTGDHLCLDEEFGSTRFDIILMMHVLEHVLNPATVFRLLVTRLEQNGILIVRVPDQSSFPSRLKQALRTIGIKRDEWGFVQPPIHLHGFRVESFRHLSLANKLELVALHKASPLDLMEFPTTERYWRTLGIQQAVYRFGRLLGSGGSLTAIMRAVS